MELEKLKALAADVTQWSNCNQAWLDQSEDDPAAVVGHINDDGETYPVATIDCDQYYAGHDSLKLAKFYAAASPDTVLKLVRAVEVHGAERDHAKACYERAVRILTGIHALLYPPRFTDNDGRTWQFKSPLAEEQMQELSDRIRALPDEIAAIDATKKETPNAKVSGAGTASAGLTG